MYPLAHPPPTLYLMSSNKVIFLDLFISVTHDIYCHRLHPISLSYNVIEFSVLFATSSSIGLMVATVMYLFY